MAKLFLNNVLKKESKLCSKSIPDRWRQEPLEKLASVPLPLAPDGCDCQAQDMRGPGSSHKVHHLSQRENFKPFLASSFGSYEKVRTFPGGWSEPP